MATKVDVLLNVLNSEQDFSDWIIYDYNYLLAGTGHCQLCGKKHLKHEFKIGALNGSNLYTAGSTCTLNKINNNPKLHYSMKEIIGLIKKLEEPFVEISRNNQLNKIKLVSKVCATLAYRPGKGYMLIYKNVFSQYTPSESLAKKDWIKKFIKIKLQSDQFNELSPQYVKLSKLSDSDRQSFLESWENLTPENPILKSTTFNLDFKLHIKDNEWVIDDSEDYRSVPALTWQGAKQSYFVEFLTTGLK